MAIPLDGVRGSDDSQFSWLHLSDIHTSLSDTYKRTRVRNALLQDLRTHIDEGRRPDLVLITGDIAFSGKKEEYELACDELLVPLLQCLELEPERLLIVPGNHDVDWKRSLRLQCPTRHDMTAEEVDDILSDDDYREMYLSPFSNYRRFARSLIPDLDPEEDPALFLTRKFVKDGHSLVVVGLNSAWLSGLHRVNAALVDHRYLAVGRVQLDEALSKAADAEFVIALLHHPFNALLEADEHVVEPRLVRDCSVILHGHTHWADMSRKLTLSGDVVVIPAGASYLSKTDRPIGYNITQVSMSDQVGTAYLRAFENSRDEFLPDLRATGEAHNGEYTLPFTGFTARAPEEGAPTVRVDRLRQYSIEIDSDAESEMKDLGLSRDDLIDEIQDVFDAHVNLQKYDYENYPAPTRGFHIVYIDKRSSDLLVRNVKSSTRNLDELASWNDVLSLYRKATRHAYRRRPEVLLHNDQLVGRVGSLHWRLRQKVASHFQRFKGYNLDPSNWDRLLDGTGAGGSEATTEQRIAFELHQSRAAEQAAFEALIDIRNGTLLPDDGLREVVLNLESCFRHIHNVVVHYPPFGP